MNTREALIVAEYKRVRESLLTQFPELVDDTKTLTDTLEGETDLLDVIDQMLRQSREDKAFADALNGIIKETRERQERLKRRAEKHKAGALALLEAAGEKKLIRPDYTASIRFTPGKVEIIDDAALPDAFVKVVTTPDKTAIKAALERGESVEGAVLGNGHESLSVRFK